METLIIFYLLVLPRFIAPPPLWRMEQNPYVACDYVADGYNLYIARMDARGKWTIVAGECKDRVPVPKRP